MTLAKNLRVNDKITASYQANTFKFTSPNALYQTLQTTINEFCTTGRLTCFQNPPQSAILFSSIFCHPVPSVEFFFCYFVTSLNDLSPYFYVLLSLVDCEQFLFFSSDLVRGVNARACVERRSRETRVSRL